MPYGKEFSGKTQVRKPACGELFYEVLAEWNYAAGAFCARHACRICLLDTFLRHCFDVGGYRPSFPRGTTAFYFARICLKGGACQK